MSVPHPNRETLSDPTGDSTKETHLSVEEYARSVATTLPPTHAARKEILPLLQHFDAFRSALQQIYRYFSQVADKNGVVLYTREWLLDNYYIIQRTVRQVEEDLPSQYYDELPKLSAGPFAGYPRIYAVARAFATFTDGHVAQLSAQAFLTSFQKETALTMGELWAWPTMLRLCALENLIWALEQTIRVNQFSRFLSPELLAQLAKHQLAPEIMVANSITDLRTLNMRDWQTFFESVSRVETLLRCDPAGVYPHMDFETRNQYRRVIEKLAAASEHDEEVVARTALDIAKEAASRNGQCVNPDVSFIEQRDTHIGYYLIDRGYHQLLQALNYQSLHKRIQHWLGEHFLVGLYIGAIVLMTLFITFNAMVYAERAGGTLAQIIVTGVAVFIPASAIAVHVTHWLLIQQLPPSRLPKLDFSDSIPAAYHTVVVVPVLLTDTEVVDSLVAQLELHYLRNTDPNLRFALLADLSDASEEQLPEDDILIELAKTRVTELNKRYGTPEYQPFYFFLRRRLWNPAESCWMGHERKRGKLAEFNQLLLDRHAETSYVVMHGDLAALAGVRYVITLDADTVMPHNAAARLIGTLAHPLNQAQFEPNSRRVTAGYTVLQPRIELLPTVKSRTLFAEIFGGDTGFDLYTLAVSDIYQDLFHEGIYVGKGIYDVAAFERSLAGRVPENALLSHDLFEGIHGRTGLVTDVVLVEDYPTHYLAFTKRLHRWIRGDWQLLPWLMPYVPNSNGDRVRNPLSALGRWKIFDNLRRSLERPALLLLFLVGWLWLPGASYLWTAFALLVFWIPFMTGMMMQINVITRNTRLTSTNEARFTNLLMRWALSLAFLLYESMITLDAIVSTLFRLVRRRRLLEWTTSATTVRIFGEQTRAVIWRQMLSGIVVTIAIGVAIIISNASALLVASPLLIIWMLAPYFAERLSQPHMRQSEDHVTDNNRRQLRMLARRTWLFFEAFVGPSDHWLPPDNYQHEPSERLKHYTSPTNIGLMLLSTFAAYDMGYIGLLDLMLRLRFAFDSISQLERYRGHLLNWYHTETLKALTPHYVSTVDSGNYAGCLLALKAGYRNLLETPALSRTRWQGLVDILDIMAEILAQSEGMQRISASHEMTESLLTLRQQIIDVEDDSSQWIEQLNTLTNDDWPTLNATFERLVVELEGRATKSVTDLQLYLSRMHHHLFGMQRDLEALLPWLVLFQRVPADVQSSGDGWRALQSVLDGIPRFGDLPEVYQSARTSLNALERNFDSQATEARDWCLEFAQALDASELTVSDLLADFEAIQLQIEQDFEAMDFRFLYDQERHLFHIGYNVNHEQTDPNHYDLLASESRLASYLAIAKGDVPYKHWLHLGRPIGMVNRGQVLYSWSGTMFEYFMPLLLMQQEANTLLSSSTAAAAVAQIAYAKQHRTPWGISESGYYGFDVNQNYQYRAFGVPELALKRDQGLNHVIAPYASVLALSLRPAAVIKNLQTFVDLDALDTYGLIEAIDYTTTHLPLGKERALVHQYMAHHQGMIFVALANFFQDNIMVQRFHSDPRVESVKLLLLEQIPPTISKEKDPTEEQQESETRQDQVSVGPWEVPIESPWPHAHYLSNGRYATMITSAGSGYSQWNGRALTRWRADTTLDDWGTWLYIRDHESGALWSAGHQPVGSTSEKLATVFHPHKVELTRRDYDISSRLEIIVPPDSDLEIRRLTLTNHSQQLRRLTVCSYGEMVLAAQGDDQRHQAFNKLFIESEYESELQALIFRRRLRSIHDEPLYVLHRIVSEERMEDPQYETDRARFLGRHGTAGAPQAFQGDDVSLSGTTGATLDPIMALAQEIQIAPYGTLELVYLTVAGDNRSDVINEARVFNNWTRIEHAFDQTRYHAERELRHLALDTATLRHIQLLFSALQYPHSAFRAPQAVLAANTQAQSGLWAHGISGDFPIMLVEVGASDELNLVHDLILAHTFWRNRGIKSTLIILNTYDKGYEQSLNTELQHLLSRVHSETWLNRHDGIFILRDELLNDADRILLQTAARIYLDGKNGSLTEQLTRQGDQQVDLPSFGPTLAQSAIEAPGQIVERPTDLVFDNGYGGFSPDGHQYMMYVTPDQPTPAPWTNVIANEHAGFIISESGGGFSWAFNSGENRLTAWRNDPVTDMPSEVLYLRDEETGTIWSPTPMPAGSGKPYLVRHGAGYTVFEHQCYGIDHNLRYYAAPDDPVKFVRLRLKNTSSRPRRITVTYYAEWVLGPTRDITQQYLIPTFDTESQILTLRNPYSIEFGAYHAFIVANKPFHGLTTNRTEFLGRMADYQSPIGLRRIGLSGTVSAGPDPCTALQLHIDLPVDGEEDVCFILGQGTDHAAAVELGRQYREAAAIESAWITTCDRWRELLERVVIRTPDAAMNMLLPWLLYQALSCRIWGRSALYQSSGAYGFRDQLQDVMSLIYARPDLTREHILRAARHQFEAGDVLHWWHPPSGRGVRTRFADDLIWLPFVVAHYVTTTGDESVLHETVPFLVGEPLRVDEEERYGFYESTDASFTVYEHCRRALEKGYTTGRHNLPLMKAGDWNDGMNRVGIEGRGESVWMAWFLYMTMARFSPLCDVMDDTASATTYQLRMAELQKAVEEHAWDGAWYRRAYYDNGTPLGSAQSIECKIDSLAQSWGVLSGAADPDRAMQAMQSVDDWLVNEPDQLIRLFTPPFDHTPHDPGYIKGYPPGIRENGGQYTHAALWFVWALTEVRQGHRAEALFRLLNPIYHSDERDKADLYQVEPYVIAADVYSESPHIGHGGWTWYTGSSGWMYRLGVEAILGLCREGAFLRIEPSISREWSHFEIDYRYGTSLYHIRVENPEHLESGVASIQLDGTKLSPGSGIPLHDDGTTHYVLIVMG